MSRAGVGEVRSLAPSGGQKTEKANHDPRNRRIVFRSMTEPTRYHRYEVRS